MHPGIELRISTPAGVIVQCDSDWAHYSTIFRGAPVGEWIVLVRQFADMPALDDGQAVVEAGAPALTVEIRAVELEDEPAVPDDARELLDEPAADVGGPCANGDEPASGCRKRARRWPWSRGDR